MKIVPGDLGTKGGLRTDVHGRVLRDDGSVIDGLYAAGNVSAPVMGHTYAGPGATIGPAMLFGYLAALHISREGLDAHRSVRRDRRRAAAQQIHLDQHRRAALPPGAGRRRRARSTRASCATWSDNTPQVLPTFGIVAPTFHVTDPPTVPFPGIEIDLAKVLHGRESVTVAGPIPPRRRPKHQPRRRRLGQGQGGGDSHRVGGDALDGTPLWTHDPVDLRPRRGRIRRRARAVDVVDSPDRPCDHEVPLPTLPQQALLYRLCGDRNPLHSDPEFAAAAGFPRPILHGLCTYGIACKAIVDACLDSDVSRVRTYGARFAGVVYPGRDAAGADLGGRRPARRRCHRADPRRRTGAVGRGAGAGVVGARRRMRSRNEFDSLLSHFR